MRDMIINDEYHFTFGTMTCNQEKYIIEHLESIKFQIEKYGNDFANKILIIDDYSKDNTVYFVQKWSEYNPHIKIEVIVNKSNLGINRNYIKLLSYINTLKFKVLAGDDLYGPNKIYNDFKYSITFSPVYNLNREKVFFPLKQILYHYMANPNILLNKLLIGNVLSAPGVYFKDKKVFSKSYIQYQIKYLHAEDYSSWLYLLFVENIDYHISVKPTIIYRTNHDRNIKSKLLLNRDKEDYLHLTELLDKLNQKKIIGIKFLFIYLKTLFNPISLLLLLYSISKQPILTKKFKNHYDLLNNKSKQFFERIKEE